MRRNVLICAGLVLLTALVFGQVWQFEFINFDDPDYVFQNPHVRKGLTAEGIDWAMQTSYASNWHPLTWISHMTDCELFGVRAGPAHMHNVLLHIVNCLLLFLLLRQMTGAIWRSGLVAGLFALHPLHVESVAWVAERKDVLSTLFWLLTILCYVRFVRKSNQVWLWISVILFGLALLAKQMVVTLPCVLVLLDIWPLRRIQLVPPPPQKEKKGRKKPLPSLSWASAFKEKVPFFVLAISAGIATLWAQHSGGAVATLEKVPFGERLGNALIAYAAYMGRLFWPAKLAIVYPLHAVDPLQVALAVVVLVAVSGLVIRYYRTRPYLLVGWLWFLGTLVPVIGLIQVGQQAMADRYTYVPLVGLFILVVWLVSDLTQTSVQIKAVAGAAGVASLIACALLAWRQVGYWKSSISVNQHALEVTADNYIAHNNLGIALFYHGKVADAITHYNASIQIQPGYADAHNNLGVALAREGKLTEAAEQYEAAIRIWPNYVEAHNNLGNVYLRQGKFADAVLHHSQAVQIKPDDAEARYNLGLGLWQQGKKEEAARQFSLALNLMPNFSEARTALSQVESSLITAPANSSLPTH